MSGYESHYVPRIRELAAKRRAEAMKLGRDGCFWVLIAFIFGLVAMRLAFDRADAVPIVVVSVLSFTDSFIAWLRFNEAQGKLAIARQWETIADNLEKGH